MSDNPYQSPTTVIEGVKGGHKSDLRKVAVCQRGVMICILINIVCYLFLLFLGGQGAQLQALILAVQVIMLITLVVQLVFVLGLARRVYNLFAGIVLVVLSIVPCIGLLVLLIVNQRATAILKRNGIHVGFMGVKLADYDWD